MSEMVPEIRFEWFEGEWEEDKLNNLVEIYDGTHQTPKYTQEGVMFLSVENIDTLISNKYISKDAFDREFKIYPKKGDLLMTRIGSVGKAKVFMNDFPVAYYVSLALLKPFKIDSFFLEASINSPHTQKEIWFRTLHIAFPKKINMNEISKVKICYPFEKEQKIIGRFCVNINNNINLKQQELIKLKQFKQAMLQKMFPKEGETVPEIRFGGFEGEWKLDKLSDIANYRNGKAHEQSIDGNGKFVVINSKFVSTEGKIRKFSTDQIEPLYKNEIAIVLSDLPNGRALSKTYFIKENGKYTLNQRIAGITPSNKVDPYFLNLTLNRNKYFLSFDDGVNQTNLSMDEVMTFEATYPTIEEQLRISNFFNTYEKYLNEKERKLTKLNQLKQALLDKMFV